MKRLEYTLAISRAKRCLVIVGSLAFLGMFNPGTSFAASSAIVAQQAAKVKISGTVLDQTKNAVIGASVAIKGTTTGTVTDIEGKFRLEVPAGSNLTISAIGYKPTVVKVTKSDAINVVLENDNVSLEQVVVVGYGSQKKANLTGAVTSIDINKTLDSRPIADVGRGLQGTTAGLSVVLPSAEVGSDPKIKVRGQIGSLNGSSSPLILMDNVEIPSITLVNPDDIESITVLKDAASASIYGAKAAFGVILISTKKGAKSDAVNVTYSANMSWQNTEKGYNMGGIEAMEYALIAAKNVDATSTGAFYKVTEEGLAKAKDWQKNYGGKIGSDDPTVYGRDWYQNSAGQKVGLRTYNAYDYLIRKWSPSQEHNLSLNGKSGTTTYNIGLGYLDQDGMNKVAKKDNFTRYNSSLRLSTQFNKYITFNAGAIYSKRTKSYPNTTTSAIDPWYYLYRWGPQYPIGNDENGNELRSPTEEFHQANTSTQEKNYTNINLGFHLNFSKDWTADFDYSHANEEYNWLCPGIRFTAADTWSGTTARKAADGSNVYVNSDGKVVAASEPGAMQAYDLVNKTYTDVGSGIDNINRQSTNSQRNTFNAYTTYNFKLNDENSFKFMAGVNRVSYVEEYHWGKITSLTDLNNVQFGNAIGTQTAGGGKSWESQLGFFGRINYDLMGKYLLEANLRYDGSSKFPTDLQWRWFPSFSAGWRASEESFMQWAKPVLSSLKFRASYGEIGDQTVSNSLYRSNLGKITQSSWLDENGKKTNFVTAPTAVASDISWQKIATLDLGIDARFLNNELGFTFDWYQRDTKDMIVGADGIADTYGTTAPAGNYGNLRTRGWELSVDYNHRFANGIGINGMFTLSDATTKITKFGSATGISGWYNDKTYGEIWGYRANRLYQDSDFEHTADGKLIKITLTEANGAKNAGKTAYKLKGDNPVYQAYLQSDSFMFMPGDVMFKDLDGDGQITYGDNTVSSHGDKEVIGNSTPRYEYGFRAGADYKGVDFSIFFQGVGKRDMWGSSSTTLAGFNTADGAMAERFCTDYWTPENINAYYPRPYSLGNGTSGYSMQVQDRYLLDMSYLRVKNITLGYTLPANLLKKAWIQKARFYASVENAYTWDHLSGTPVDPELIPGEGLLSVDNYQAGRAGISTPSFRTFSVGLQLNF
ncbi:TonB-dependent receptor [uncultured Acetobacteroides sp.]|uniref:SusC/RagA family TonB-linked outer membrane protein n=1 Tax=uncultured Acetobacteroides sp. TaxID=1760811 RepID=UPI0029F4CABA|nr:TonB-dependent receptor [uncultured Acetobacteroides sp.]